MLIKKGSSEEKVWGAGMAFVKSLHRTTGRPGGAYYVTANAATRHTGGGVHEFVGVDLDLTPAARIWTSSAELIAGAEYTRNELHVYTVTEQGGQYITDGALHRLIFNVIAEYNGFEFDPIPFN